MTLFKTTYDGAQTTDGTLLISKLRDLFDGQLVIPKSNQPDRPYVVGIFAATLDGVTAFRDVVGQDSGGDISAFNKSDGFMLALLRSLVDAVIVGANTLRREPNHLWTPEFMYPEAGRLFSAQRQEMRLSANPLVVFLTRTGNIPNDAQIFQRQDIPTTIFRGQDERKVLQTLAQEHGVKRVLIEGPSVFATLLGLGLVDELFLTTVPRIAGNGPEVARPSLGSGVVFQPGTTPWFKRVTDKTDVTTDGQIGDYLFSRFVLTRP